MQEQTCKGLFTAKKFKLKDATSKKGESTIS